MQKITFAVPLLLFFTQSLDSQHSAFDGKFITPSTSFFYLQSITHSKQLWISHLKTYCFYKKELTFQLHYEFAPMPVPNYFIENSIIYFYISVELGNEVKMDALADIWKSALDGEPLETICFEAVYNPPHSKGDAAFLMAERLIEPRSNIEIFRFRVRQ